MLIEIYNFKISIFKINKNPLGNIIFWKNKKIIFSNDKIWN